MAERRSATTTTPSQEDLAKQMEQLRSDVGEITRTLSDLTKGQVTELRARGRETAEHATARARDIEHQAEDYVRERPLQALAIAAGVGLLVGYLSRGR